MKQELWVKEVENPTIKPLNQWREELYGYWMVFYNSQDVGGERMAAVRYYGTDKEKLYDLYDELHSLSDEPTVGILQNKRGNNWMGGVFLIKGRL